MKGKAYFGIIPAILFCVGISSALAENAPALAGQEKDAAADCSTAEDDIAKLNAEKMPTSDKAVDGVLGVTPIGLVTNVVTGGDKMEEGQKMEAEEHNKKIEARIEEIRKTCPESANSDSPLPGSD